MIERYAEWTDLFGYKEGILKTFVPHSMPQPCLPKLWGSKIWWFINGLRKRRAEGFFLLFVFSYSVPLSPFNFPFLLSFSTLYLALSTFFLSSFLFSLSLAWIIFFQEPLWKWSLCILNTYNLFQLVFFLQLVMTRQVCKQTLRSIMDAKLFFTLVFLRPS